MLCWGVLQPEERTLVSGMEKHKTEAKLYGFCGRSSARESFDSLRKAP